MDAIRAPSRAKTSKPPAPGTMRLKPPSAVPTQSVPARSSKAVQTRSSGSPCRVV